MHCVSTYPCPIENLNLNLISTLKKKYKCEVGYSGHESSVSPSIITYMLGARYIERHITLDRSMWGTDQAASLSENGMKTLSNILNKSSLVLGDGVKRLSKQETNCWKNLNIGNRIIIFKMLKKNIIKNTFENGYVKISNLLSLKK